MGTTDSRCCEPDRKTLNPLVPKRDYNWLKASEGFGCCRSMSLTSRTGREKRSGFMGLKGNETTSFDRGVCHLLGRTLILDCRWGSQSASAVVNHGNNPAVFGVPESGSGHGTKP